ncbi:hypothetical protein DFH07DRAFT_974126 [Mycena maculata]|uniref:Uncharacterized protein n=1 Tax=Mycena maculata TaxID=230809 RepID=A0AAD7HA21_9AGAR|nr:hypothetical protein DFH07DRAFT_974126 [Mycena maculata]
MPWQQLKDVDGRYDVCFSDRLMLASADFSHISFTPSDPSIGHEERKVSQDAFVPQPASLFSLSAYAAYAVAHPQLARIRVSPCVCGSWYRPSRTSSSARPHAESPAAFSSRRRRTCQIQHGLGAPEARNSSTTCRASRVRAIQQAIILSEQPRKTPNFEEVRPALLPSFCPLAPGAGVESPLAQTFRVYDAAATETSAPRIDNTPHRPSAPEPPPPSGSHPAVLSTAVAFPHVNAASDPSGASSPRRTRTTNANPRSVLRVRLRLARTAALVREVVGVSLGHSKYDLGFRDRGFLSCQAFVSNGGNSCTHFVFDPATEAIRKTWKRKWDG